MTPEAQRRLGHALQECLTAALLVGCARMRDWQQVDFAELAVVVGGDLMAWQGRLAEGMMQQEEGAKFDQQIAENLRWLGYEW